MELNKMSKLYMAIGFTHHKYSCITVKILCIAINNIRKTPDSVYHNVIGGNVGSLVSLGTSNYKTS